MALFALEIMPPSDPRRFMMYRHEVQKVGTEVKNHEAELLGVEGERDSTGRICLHCMAGTIVWGLVAILVYLLICTGVVFAIP